MLGSTDLSGATAIGDYLSSKWSNIGSLLKMCRRVHSKCVSPTDMKTITLERRLCDQVRFVHACGEGVFISLTGKNECVCVRVLDLSDGCINS